MEQNRIEDLAYSHYFGYLRGIWVNLLRDNKELTKEEAIKKVKEERILRKREETSPIKKIGRKLGIISPYSRHVPQYYDMALCLMKYLQKDCLTKDDFFFAQTREFFDKFFKDDYVKLTEFELSYPMDRYLKGEEQKAFDKRWQELSERVVPPYNDLENEEVLEK